ncbi:MAG: hypothetical protein IPH56_08835 [Chitinophagaceae bacterium]|nr:hypothetical protein [Chitinophagaceae bacterium]
MKKEFGGLKKMKVDEVLSQYDIFKKQFENNHVLISAAMQNWFKSFPKAMQELTINTTSILMIGALFCR